jgi:hypothetical protein
VPIFLVAFDLGSDRLLKSLVEILWVCVALVVALSLYVPPAIEREDGDLRLRSGRVRNCLHISEAIMLPRQQFIALNRGGTQKAPVRIPGAAKDPEVAIAASAAKTRAAALNNDSTSTPAA